MTDRAKTTTDRYISVGGSLQISLVIAIAAFAARLLLVLATHPDANPDVFIYTAVAKNIYLNHCVSRSDPASGACTPSWGSDQPLPGYPAFISLAWLIGGPSTTSILILQSFAAAAAIGRFAYAIAVFTRRRELAFAVGCLLSVTPLELGFSRAVMTEALATATTIWVFAELILSLAEKRLRILTVGASLLSAIFVRADGILLCILTAGVGFYIHRPAIALRRGMLLALIVLAPVGAWALRCVFDGLPLYPGLASAYWIDWAAPSGMVQWGNTWMVSEGEERDYLFPILQARYSEIAVPSNIYVDATERRAVQDALAILAHNDGKPVSTTIDGMFAKLAANRRSSYPFATFIVAPIERSLAMWTNPYYRFDWPIPKIDSRVGAAIDAEVHSGVAGLWSVIRSYPREVTQRALIYGYRVVIVGVFLVIAALSGFGFLSPLRPLIALTGAYAGLRTVFFAVIVVPGVETRYLVEVLPGMEAVCVLGAALFLRSKASQSVIAKDKQKSLSSRPPGTVSGRQSMNWSARD